MVAWKRRVDDLVVHGGADRLPAHRSVRHAIAVLRRIGRVGDQVALAIVDQEVEEELRGFLHDGIGFAAQERTVQAVLIALPEVQGEPRSAHRPDADVSIVDRRGVAPGVDVVVEHEAAGAVHLLRRPAAAVERHPDQVEQRPGGFGQVADFRRPVVHLDVDVGRVLAVPGRCEALVPDALEVGRHRAGAAAAHQQVAAELEVQGGEPGIFLPALDARQTLVGRKALERRIARRPRQGQLDAPEQLLVIRDVGSLEGGDTAWRRGPGTARRPRPDRRRDSPWRRRSSRVAALAFDTLRSVARYLDPAALIRSPAGPPGTGRLSARVWSSSALRRSGVRSGAAASRSSGPSPPPAG